MSDETQQPVQPDDGAGAGRVLDSESWDALMAAGIPEQDLLADQPLGPVISSYTRAQAIADGVLVDLMQESAAGLVREAGFKYPIAMTVGAFGEAVGAVGEELPAGQSVTGRVWDVLMMLKHCIRQGQGGDRVDFWVMVDPDGQGHHKRVNLYSLCGPGDNGEPVVTILLPGED